MVTVWATVVDPIAGVAVALAPLAVIGTWAVTRSEEAMLGAVLFGSASVMIAQEGVGSAEIVFAIVLVAYLGYWYGSRLWSGEALCDGYVDRAVAILIAVFLPLGLIIGLGAGASINDIRGDAMGFASLALYFPVKEAARRNPRGAIVVGLGILWLGVYAATHTMLNFRSMVARAVLDWQVADARPGYNGVQLISAAILSLALAIHARRRWAMFALLVVFAYMMGALILIKYRAFWIAVAFGIVVLGALVDQQARRRLIVASLVGVALSFGLFFFVLGDLVTLFLAGTADRAATLGGLGQDVSLINRFWEAGFVLERAVWSPIVGYGFGTRYDYYSLVYRVTYHVKHIHIGYVSPLFRFGLLGTVLLFFAWGGGTLMAWRAYRTRLKAHLSRIDRAMSISSVAILISMVLSVLSESPWFIINMMLGFTLVLALGVGLYQRGLTGALAGAAQGEGP